MPEQHTILGGKVHVYKRPNSSLWQCSSYFAGKNRRTSTKEESLSKAKEIAEDWYLPLCGKLRAGEIKSEKTYREVSEQYLREYDIITQGQRNTQYVNGQHWRSSVHLLPFFGNLGISEITAGTIQEYRIHRHQQAIAERGKPPGHSTMHQEIVTLRQPLNTALRHGWLDRLPDFSEPYRSSPKISHWAWFSPEEYKKLYEATRKRAQEPKKKGFQWKAKQLHDYVPFAVTTRPRPAQDGVFEVQLLCTQGLVEGAVAPGQGQLASATPGDTAERFGTGLRLMTESRQWKSCLNNWPMSQRPAGPTPRELGNRVGDDKAEEKLR